MEPSNSLTFQRQLSKELLFTHFRYIFGSFPPECPSPSAISTIVATRETVVLYLQLLGSLSLELGEEDSFYDPMHCHPTI